MRSPDRLLLPLFVALVLAAGLAAPALAQQSGSRSARVTRLDVDLAVQNGGSMAVRETEEFAFQGAPPFTRASRRIALQRVDGIRDVRVEEPGQPYRSGASGDNTYSVSRQNGDLVIEWRFPETTNGTRTFVVSYVVDGVIRLRPDLDELRWIVIGSQHSYPVDHVAVTLRLPAAVADGGWQLAAYPGQFNTPGAMTAAGATASWQSKPLPANEAFQVRAAWPHGLVTGAPPSWQAAADAADRWNEGPRQLWDVVLGAAGVLVLLFGGLWVLLTWYTRGKDVPVGAVPQELDAPPSDLPPGLAGTLVDERADVRDVIATVLDLARRGVIRISEVRDDNLAGSQRDFEVELLAEDTSALRPFERRVLDTFFLRGNPVRLSQLGDWFHQAIPVIRDALYEEVAREGLFAGNPENVRRRYRRIGNTLMLAGAALGIASCGAVGSYVDTAAWPFVSAVLVGALVRFVAPRMPRRTAAGALEAARWQAYARYLHKAKPDAMARVAHLREDGHLENGDRRAEVFEQTLPYAVAFGIERDWVQKFATVGTPAPRWLQTPPVVVVGGPGWGGPWMGGPWGGGWSGGSATHPSSQAGPAPNGAGGPQGPGDRAAGGLEHTGGSLLDMLQRASDALSRGGDSGWGGGGFGGGFFGGGESGGSGGGGGDVS